MRRSRVLPLLALLLCGTARAVPSGAQREFELANTHYERAEFDQAIERFEAAYRADPDPVYLYNIAQCHRQAGRPREAIEYYTRYLEQAPDASNAEGVRRRISEIQDGLVALGGKAEAEPPPAGELPEQSRIAQPAEERGQAIAVFREGRALLKQRRFREAAARLGEAVALGKSERLPADTLAELHYAHASALLKTGDEVGGIAALRRACALSPGDAEMRLDLAFALAQGGEHEEARREAERALSIGLSAKDAAEAREIVREAHRRHLKSRLIFDATLSMGYDSNILQGNRGETIGGQFTGGAREAYRVLVQRQERLMRAGTVMAVADRAELVRDFIAVLSRLYMSGAKPPASEESVPISVALDLSGRALTTRRVELWAGYRFSQLAMTFPDQDPYNFQEHSATLSMTAAPFPWWRLRVEAIGFANFTGLIAYSPFQGGAQGTIESTFSEGRLLRTRITYLHQHRASFSDEDRYLDAQRDEVRLWQEVRAGVGPARLSGRLGYQLRSDRTGVLKVPIELTEPFSIEGAAGTSSRVFITGFLYQAPLGYMGHEASGLLRIEVPWQLEISLAARYERRFYDGVYRALLTGERVVTDPRTGRETITELLASLAPATEVARRDHRISGEITVARQLPHGFGIELSYALLYNLSNIVNALDNRSYSRHSVLLFGTYSF